ncbi:MAG TPA: hypothetical protein VGE52_13780, partial [Pirellulales bacterium]
VSGDALLVLLNEYGVNRLDPATGDPLWESPVRLSSRRSPGLLDRLTGDATTLYAVADGELQAIQLADGRPKFDRPASVGRPEASFVARLLPGAVAVFPSDPFASRPEFSLLSAKDGRLVQRLPLGFGDAAPVFSWRRPASLHLLGRSAIVSTHGAFWTLQPR